MNQYEAMFLFDPTFGSSFEKCESEIHRLMERAQAKIIFCRKWDERRLAYRIKERKRGVYVLVYFNAPSEKITSLERDVQISEDILRVLVVRADGVTQEMIESVLGPVQTASCVVEAAAPSPGMLPRHYAPATPLALAGEVNVEDLVRKKRIGALLPEPASLPSGFAVVETLTDDGNLRTAAARFFAALRRLDAADVDMIVAWPFPDQGLGRALNDRLTRAAGRGQ